jgi:oxalate---CoA ligase
MAGDLERLEKLLDDLDQGGNRQYWIWPIQIGSRDRIPFFSMGGWEISRWGKFLGDDQPVYSLFTRQAGDKPSPTIRDTATSYLREIQEVQPRGPYMLAGFCRQGPVAFEIAQKLQAQGQPVAFLALFDAVAPAPLRVLLGDQLHYLRRRLAFHAGKVLALKGKDKARYILTILRNARLNLALVTRRHVAGLRMWLCRCLSRMRWRPQAGPADPRPAESYVATPYSGSIHVFVSNLHDYARDPTLGWRRLARGGVQVHSVPFDHKEMFEEKNFQEWSKQLKCCLEDAQNAFSSPPQPRPVRPRATAMSRS